MNYTGEILKLFFILGVLLGIMYIMLRLVRKYLYSFDKTTAGKMKISVLSTQGIAPKKAVSVIRIKQKIYVLGVSDESITLIDKLESDEPEEEPASQLPEGKNFLSILKSNLGLK